VGGDPRGRRLDQGLVAGARAGAEHEDGVDALAPPLVGNAKHRGLGDVGMLVDHPPVGRDPEPRLEVGAGVVGEDADDLAGRDPETLQGGSERSKASVDVPPGPPHEAVDGRLAARLEPGRALERPRKRSVHVFSFRTLAPEPTPGREVTVPNRDGTEPHTSANGRETRFGE
jgi:hypothetical protein